MAKGPTLTGLFIGCFCRNELFSMTQNPSGGKSSSLLFARLSAADAHETDQRKVLCEANKTRGKKTQRQFGKPPHLPGFQPKAATNGKSLTQSF